ncbi:uncharacterized protein LOC131290800 [Anopheles ziemanni]|uniref:uncharacterized protein LOC131269229 n=1 Tax=Anopheles coustani TaxID=139045 RepID=UPI00265AF1B8|nr:uncharacterized protein LOC131269229 [Anopheles coustani]XP_058175960.1 uncharacterized protein LOC131290800 [Anopheles ziemanni]
MVLLDCLLQLRSLRSLLASNGNSLREAVNTIFWLSCILGVLFLQFKRLLRVLLRLGRLQGRKFAQIAHHLWNICFYTASTIFLLLYQMLLIRPEVVRESGKYFPQYNNAIFATACDPAKLEIITLVLVSFKVFGTVAKLSNGDYSEAFSNVLYGTLLMCCLLMRLENYCILLNLYTAVYSAFEEFFLLFACHVSKKRSIELTCFVILKFCTWSYLFLNVLPFEFLIPTLYARSDLFTLKLCFWLWYCSCIWNSPLLKLLYHQIYHTHPKDCAGGDSAIQCILSSDWRSYRHFRNLEHAYYELKLHQSREKMHSTRSGENVSMTAFQTIKCVVSLKRKLKRLRENRDQMAKHQ